MKNYAIMIKEISLSFFVLVFAFTARADTVYVVPADTPNHTPSGDYDYWTNAAVEIQTAVDKAASLTWTNVVVSNGTPYVLTGQIEINSGMYIRSYNDGATDPEGTIISGNNVTRCLYLDHEDIVIEGFTITEGNADYGAGVAADYNLQNKPIIKNCVITNNVSTDYGGGVFRAVLDGCVIVDNSANGGSGRGGGAYYCTILNNSQIIHNHASERGAGVYGGSVEDSYIASNNSDYSGGGVFVAIVKRCVVEDNTADIAGGIYCGIVSDTQVLGNHANVTGGGVYGGYVSNCLVAHNSSDATGGGVHLGYFGASTGIVINTRIESNTAVSHGGGVYFSVDVTDGVNAPFFSNNHVVGNEASEGAGMYFRTYRTPAVPGAIVNCLITSNAAVTQGGGLRSRDADKPCFHISSCTIVNNTAASGGGIYWPFPMTNTVVYHNHATSGPADIVTISANSNHFWYSCLGDMSFDPAQNQGNIRQEPSFAGTNTGNYRLMSGSPCINSGTNQPGMENTKDLDGRPRLDRFSRKVDIGCYEHMPHGILYKMR